MWKAGRTEIGVRTVASHTGSLAGNSAVFDAALKQSGVVGARNVEELLDLAIGFTCPVLPRGNRLGALVEAGGGAVAGADVHEALGLEMPTFSMATQKELADALQGVIPTLPGGQNPVDIVWVPLEVSGRTFVQGARIILKDVDAALIITYADLDEHFATGLVALRDELKKPIIVIPGYAGFQRMGMSLLARNGIPTFNIPERALKALSAMVHYSDYLHQS